ncbi:kinase-like protein [Lindgomyces ingoldianus]|uniref:Kinase-like protein n=1 Tax=Lindgomyces ingoldianus TaxID=673940 RepID=A0ACB6RFB1_9PLEO|nr:kinase-like protein [Lindgomyces ingoldianus]KAF2477886.1 kinase-like protein [Lindgomyces ingoldianus]
MDEGKTFWPDQLLRKIMSRERVEEELESIQAEEYLGEDIENGAENAIEPDVQSEGVAPGRKRYLKIFTILVLCEQEASIRGFIEAGVSDDALPLVQCDKDNSNGLFKLALRKSPLKELRCFPKWKRTDGGFGLISCMRIHPACHGFHELAQVRVGNGMFALKIMKSQGIEDFEKELKMLRMFSDKHDHLIMLLMSYSWGNRHFLVFPWADCDLGNYWKRKKPCYDMQTRALNLSTMKWVSRQIRGLTSGLHNIHNPKHLDTREDKRYGRHGDLKPENIFWLKSDKDEEGILVIGDLGISAIHRLETRSNQPGKKIPYSPDYRPPECDQEGGIISRAFDIWTLGCLFLEMVCWVLGGIDLVERFEADRAKVLYLGSKMNTNIFFDIKKTEHDHHVILVKEVVVEWMSTLHAHPGCTGYIHDLLDIIHDKMIVVLSKKMERIRSGPLLAKIEELHRNVAAKDYGQIPLPKERKYAPPIGVRAELNEHARDRVKNFSPILDTYRGETINSKSKPEMEQVD